MYKLRQYQQRVVDEVLRGRSLITAPCGSGKSVIAQKLCYDKHTLVITPASVVPQMKEYFDGPHHLVISHNKFVMKTHLEKTILPFILKGDCHLVIDECQILGNPQNKICKTLLKIKPKIIRTYMFSACPAPNSLLEYFMASTLANECLGAKYQKFLLEYSELVRGLERVPNTGLMRRNLLRMGFKQEPKEGGAPIMAKLPSFVSVITQDEISREMPEKLFMTRTFKLSSAQVLNHRTLVRDSIATIEDKTMPITSRLAVAQKILQNESGFVYDETGHPLKLESHKLECLKALLSEIGAEPVIIFTQYRFEAKVIREALKQVTASAEAFKSGKFQYLVAHPKSAGVGVSLEFSGIVIFYTNSFSWNERMQAEGRTFRLTQKRKTCRYYDIIPEGGGVSAKIIEALKAKKELTDTVEAVLNESRNSYPAPHPKTLKS